MWKKREPQIQTILILVVTLMLTLKQNHFMLQTDPVYLTAVLLLLVVLSEWLGQRPFFKYLGSSLIVIIAAAVLANLGVIPSSRQATPLYEGIFTYIAPLAIFYLLLDVKLSSIRLAGLPMILLFLLGAAGTVAGTMAGYYLLIPHHPSLPDAFAIAGMYTGTYIGGSANLNAVALEYGVFKNGTLFAAINAADNIITAIWMIVTLALPPLLQRWLPLKHPALPPENGTENPATPAGDSTAEPVTLMGLSTLLALGAGTLFLSGLINRYVPQVPTVLILTTLALMLAQVKVLQSIKGGNLIGFLLVLLFLAVVGAYCDIGALIENKDTAILLLEWVFIIVAVHGLLLFTIRGLF